MHSGNPCILNEALSIFILLLISFLLIFIQFVDAIIHLFPIESIKSSSKLNIRNSASLSKRNGFNGR